MLTYYKVPQYYTVPQVNTVNIVNGKYNNSIWQYHNYYYCRLGPGLDEARPSRPRPRPGPSRPRPRPGPSRPRPRPQNFGLERPRGRGQTSRPNIPDVLYQFEHLICIKYQDLAHDGCCSGHLSFTFALVQPAVLNLFRFRRDVCQLFLLARVQAAKRQTLHGQHLSE